MRKSARSTFQYLLAGIVGCASLSIVDSSAQSYPSKPIRVFAHEVGGGNDVAARLLAPKLSENVGQPVVIENRSGAGGSIATEAVAKSPPDGYTLLILAASDTIVAALHPKLPYDLERDFAPVSLVAAGTAVLVVHPSLPARDVKELIALARSNPGKLNYGSSGVGNSSHLMGELFNVMAGVKIVHVPYKGSAGSSAATAAGEIEMSFPSIVAVGPLLKAGKIKALAVTSARRNSLMPSLPTIGESGLPGYDRSTWWGVVAPTGVPREVIVRLQAGIFKAVNTPEVKTAFNRQGLDPQTEPGTPEQFAAFVRGEIAQSAKLVKLSGAKTD